MKPWIIPAALLMLASGGWQNIARAEEGELQRLNPGQDLLLAEDGWRERAAAASAQREAEAERREAERKAAIEARLKEKIAAKATGQILETIARAWAEDAAKRRCGRMAIPDSQSALSRYRWLFDACQEAVEAGEMEAVVEEFMPGMRSCLLNWRDRIARNQRPTDQELDCLRNRMDEGL